MMTAEPSFRPRGFHPHEHTSAAHTIDGSGGSSSSSPFHNTTTTQRDSTETMRVAVEPPAQIQIHQTLHPPLVVSCAADADVDFVQVTVLDANGRFLVTQLAGTRVRHPQALDDDGGGDVGGSNNSNNGGCGTVYAAFPDLAFTQAGVFRLYATAVRMEHGGPAQGQAVVVMAAASRKVQVCDKAVAGESPDADERTLLRKLRRHGGFGVHRVTT